jgi:hypothetical protein
VQRVQGVCQVGGCNAGDRCLAALEEKSVFRNGVDTKVMLQNAGIQMFTVPVGASVC